MATSNPSPIFSRSLLESPQPIHDSEWYWYGTSIDDVQAYGTSIDDVQAYRTSIDDVHNQQLKQLAPKIRTKAITIH